MDAPLPHQRQGMDDGKKLTYIISTKDRSEVEDALACRQVDPLVLHLSRIAGAAGIYSPGIGFHLGRQRQHCVMTIIWRIDYIFHT